MANKGNRKIWGFIVVWLVLFLIVKSIEKILLITAVGAAIYWGSKALRKGEPKDKQGSQDKQGVKRSDR